MEIIARIGLKRVGTEGDDLPRRIAWLAKFSHLGRLDVEVLAVLAGLSGGSAPDPDGWPIDAIAARVGLPARTVEAALIATAPLVTHGLVRVSGPSDPRVLLNERIEQFLFAPPRG
jgi:hypothetical protein